MALQGVAVAHADLVGGGQTDLHSHAGGGGGGRYIQLDIHAEADANATWTNMPAAETFLFGNWRHVHKVDLSDSTQGRLVVTKLGTAGNTGAKMILRYSTTFSTSVGNYSDVGTSEISVGVDTTNTVLDSGWVNLASGAKADIFLAVIGSGGNGVLDPIFGNISAQFK
jgi:hypothetical protein